MILIHTGFKVMKMKFILYDITQSLTPNLSWAVDYPMLAYKSISPDNREIVLVHLVRNIPQRSIHLKNYELLSFVDGKFKFEDSRCQIVLLVKNRKTKEVKLKVVFIDPWKEIDSDQAFDCPENIFEVKETNIKL